MKQLLFLLLLPLTASAESTCLNLFTESISQFLIFQGVEFRQKDGVYVITPSEKTALNQVALAEKKTFHRSLVIWQEPTEKATFLPHVLVLSWETALKALLQLEREGFTQETHNLIRMSAYRDRKILDNTAEVQTAEEP